MTSFDSAPNLDSISAIKALSRDSFVSSMCDLNPRLRLWIMAPPRIRRKFPKASEPEKTIENTSASVSVEEVMTDLA